MMGIFEIKLLRVLALVCPLSYYDVDSVLSSLLPKILNKTQAGDISITRNYISHQAAQWWTGNFHMIYGYWKMELQPSLTLTVPRSGNNHYHTQNTDVEHFKSTHVSHCIH